MTAKECIRILREHPRISVARAKALTGLSTENVKKYAAYAGIELVSGAEMREICNDRPHSCHKCPFDDCICTSPATAEETEFVEGALGTRRADRRNK